MSSYNTTNASSLIMFNQSDFNATEEAPESTDQYELRRIFLTSLYVLILVFSLFGNGAIIAILLKYKRMRTTANFLILNMAISDLLTTVIVIPRMLDIAITGSWAYKLHNVILLTVLCKTVDFTRELSCAVSVLSIIAIAVDRFYAIIFPLREKPRCLSLRIVVPGIWLVSGLLYSPAFYTYRLEEHNGVFYCMYKWDPAPEFETEKWFLFTMSIIFVVLPLCILSLLYSIIALQLRRQRIPGTTASGSVRARQRTNKNIIKLSTAIIITFFICWVPYNVQQLVFVFKYDFQLPSDIQHAYIFYIASEVFTAFTYVSIAINPYICLVFSGNFRQSFKETFCCEKTERGVELKGVATRRGTESTPFSTAYNNIALSVFTNGFNDTEASSEKGVELKGVATRRGTENTPISAAHNNVALPVLLSELKDTESSCENAEKGGELKDVATLEGTTQSSSISAAYDNLVMSAF